MKELSIEQKAKRYDEALEKAHKLCAYPTTKPFISDLQDLFPELAESEDERIRKWIIAYLENRVMNASITDEKDNCLDAIRWLEKQGESTDKVEPKFHKGDWVVHHGTENIYQVVNVIDNQYQLKYGDTYTVQKCADVDRCARLWNITKDAKPGDVLSCESGWTCIFKTLVNNETFSSYCFMDKTKWFCNTGSECHTLNKAFINAYNREIHPATKEQRDTFEKAMADAGYTFDFEKKELKKIEQKPAWSEDNDSHICNIINWLDVCKAYNQDAESVKLISQHIAWLKSLRPQSHWKPSEEQMAALELAVNDWYGDGVAIIDSLYNDLKKL